MSDCKVAYKKIDGTEEKALLFLIENDEKLFIRICDDDEPVCPTPLAAQAAIALRYHVDTTKILITWADANEYDVEEPLPTNGYTLEHRSTESDEWMLIATLYPGFYLGNGWPGANDPIIEYLHEIINTNDATRQYRIRAFNHCGNYSAYTIIGVDPPFVGFIRIHDEDGDAFKEFVAFGWNDQTMEWEAGQYNVPTDMMVKTSGENWYIESIYYGNPNNYWFTLWVWNDTLAGGAGGWEVAQVGSGTVYQTGTLIRLVCDVDEPGEKNAYIRFKINSGSTVMLNINTSQM